MRKNQIFIAILAVFFFSFIQPAGAKSADDQAGTVTLVPLETEEGTKNIMISFFDVNEGDKIIVTAEGSDLFVMAYGPLDALLEYEYNASSEENPPQGVQVETNNNKMTEVSLLITGTANNWAVAFFAQDTTIELDYQLTIQRRSDLILSIIGYSAAGIGGLILIVLIGKKRKKSTSQNPPEAELFCPQCGKRLLPNAGVCEECGHPAPN